MSTYRLTVKQKREWRPILAKHYGGYHCFYCKKPFDESVAALSENFDHLNDKEWDNRISNVVLSHVACNEKKKYDADYQIMAKEQLQMNEKDGVLEKMGEREKKNRKQEHKKEEAAASKDNEEIYSNAEFMKITREYIAEKLSIDDEIPFKSSIDAIAMKCFNQIGHGSPNTIRRIIDMLTSSEGHYIAERDGGKRWIRKRERGLFTK